MSDTVHTAGQPTPKGAVLLTIGGTVAALGVASCCALPLLFASLGIGAAWLGGVGSMAAPHRQLLLVASAALLAGGGLLLARQQRAARACRAGSACASPAMRVATFAGLVAGIALLCGGYAYG